jgi:hypothetical protein
MAIALAREAIAPLIFQPYDQTPALAFPYPKIQFICDRSYSFMKKRSHPLTLKPN